MEKKLLLEQHSCKNLRYDSKWIKLNFMVINSKKKKNKLKKTRNKVLLPSVMSHEMMFKYTFFPVSWFPVIYLLILHFTISASLLPHHSSAVSILFSSYYHIISQWGRQKKKKKEDKKETLSKQPKTMGDEEQTRDNQTKSGPPHLQLPAVAMTRVNLMTSCHYLQSRSCAS